MAEIWRAGDEVLERPVALKLPTNLRTRPETLHLAWREARMAARLSHPNIAAVHDYGEAVRPDGTVAPFVVMELLAGETPGGAAGPRPVDPARGGRRIGAAGRRRAGRRARRRGGAPRHQAGQRHADPDRREDPRLRHQRRAGEPDDDETGATFGTPAYVAPERLDGKPAEPATDVYGLGVLLFEMVTGEPPYPVDTWEELAAARVAGPGRLPADVPAAFRDLVGRCLAEDPADRPTAAETRRAVAALAEDPADRPTAAETRPAMATPAEDTGPPPASTFAAGRASAATLDLEPPAGRRIAVGAVAAAVVLAIVGIVTALNASRATTDAGPPTVATAPTPVTSPTAPPPPSVGATSGPFVADSAPAGASPPGPAASAPPGSAPPAPLRPAPLRPAPLRPRSASPTRWPGCGRRWRTAGMPAGSARTSPPTC